MYFWQTDCRFDSFRIIIIIIIIICKYTFGHSQQLIDQIWCLCILQTTGSIRN
jgi:hypothetical protein